MCPVIPHGSHAQVIQASIKLSPLWRLFFICHLSIPIHNASNPNFTDFVDTIGDGAGPDVNISFLDHIDTANNLIDFIYLPNVLSSPYTCLIHTLPNKQSSGCVQQHHHQLLTGYIMYVLCGKFLKKVEDAGIESPDSILNYVAWQTPPGLPPHSLTIKVNTIY